MSKSDGGPTKKRRGLSADDKRRVLLNIYHEKAEPFNLKELESLGSKAGVVQQTIKDINQSLVDDNLVQLDKIGTGNVFWSFPIKTIQDQVTLRARLGEEKVQLQRQVKELEEKIQAERSVRVAPDRREKLKELHDLLEEEKALDKELTDLKGNDPEAVIRIEKQCKINLDAANRWTENLYSLKSFLVKKKGMSSKDAAKFLHLDTDFDYLEDK